MYSESMSPKDIMFGTLTASTTRIIPTVCRGGSSLFEKSMNPSDAGLLDQRLSVVGFSLDPSRGYIRPIENRCDLRGLLKKLLPADHNLFRRRFTLAANCLAGLD
jgi:hypothetical protein